MSTNDVYKMIHFVFIRIVNVKKLFIGNKPLIFAGINTYCFFYKVAAYCAAASHNTQRALFLLLKVIKVHRAGKAGRISVYAFEQVFAINFKIRNFCFNQRPIIRFAENVTHVIYLMRKVKRNPAAQ